MNDTALRDALRSAIEAVRVFHGPVEWETYRDHSPEMKRWQAALAYPLAPEPTEPPPEVQTEGERKAYCFGWWKAMEGGVPKLLAEIDHLRSSLECEKRLRKDAEARREELMESQAAQAGLGITDFDPASELKSPKQAADFLRACADLAHDDAVFMAHAKAVAQMFAAAPTAPKQPPEVRLNEDGTLDEVVGIGAFHLEQMSDGHWWMSIANSAGQVTVSLTTRGTIKATYEAEPAAQTVKGEQ